MKSESPLSPIEKLEAEKAIRAYSRRKKLPKAVKAPRRVLSEAEKAERDKAKMAEYRCNHRAELYAANREYYLKHKEAILERRHAKSSLDLGGDPSRTLKCLISEAPEGIAIADFPDHPGKSFRETYKDVVIPF